MAHQTWFDQIISSIRDLTVVSEVCEPANKLWHSFEWCQVRIHSSKIKYQEDDETRYSRYFIRPTITDNINWYFPRWTSTTRNDKTASHHRQWKFSFFPNSATRTAAVTLPCIADGRGFLLTGGKEETSSDLDLLLALLFRKLSINNQLSNIDQDKLNQVINKVW